MRAFDDAPAELWIFGYGLMMWQPGFDFVEKRPARIIGVHRSMCVYSTIYRGTPQHPGLVLGLDRGGACKGTAFRIAPEQRNATISYLRSREQVTPVYQETIGSMELLDGMNGHLDACFYVVDPGHVEYASPMSVRDEAKLIERARGTLGTNRDYVLETASHLRALNCLDDELRELAQELTR